MNYNPGVPNGVWGGMTAGALAGFINDRHIGCPAPTSLEAFNEISEQITLELSHAEADGYKRPVTELRASGDIKVVSQVAPEVVPAKRSFLASAWAAIVAFVTAAWNTVSDQVSSAWNFFTEHKDSIPTDHGLLTTIWGYITSVPGTVWLVLCGVGLAFIAFNSRQAVTKITENVQTGQRQ